MTDPTRWVAKDGTPGYVVVTGTRGRYLVAERLSSTGAFIGIELMERAPSGRGRPSLPSERGPKGYKRDGPPPKNTRKVHRWGPWLTFEKGVHGNRCGACELERTPVDTGGNFAVRRTGGIWERPERTPTCGVPR